MRHGGSECREAERKKPAFGAVRRQRCIFHPDMSGRNVARDVVGHDGMTLEEKRARVLAALEEASAIYDAPSAAAARAAAFRAHWQEQEPKAVATLEPRHVGEMTLTCYAVLAEAQATGCEWRPESIRTTSLLEGENGSLRAKRRQAPRLLSGRVKQVHSGWLRASASAMTRGTTQHGCHPLWLISSPQSNCSRISPHHDTAPRTRRPTY